MLEEFNVLTEQESETMLQAPVLIAILIAGADNEIDRAEKDWAAKLAKYRKVTTKDERLQNYFREVEVHFDEWFNRLVALFPDDAAQRNPLISTELSKLNDILPKLAPDFAAAFYDNMRSFAESIAKASGGFLSIASISEDERKWLELPMINKPG